MIQSMTGYGKAVVTLHDKKVHVEIRSLNSKALDLSVRMASLYREKEMEVRQSIAKALTRGKVDVTIWIEKNAEGEAAVINGALLSAYYRQLSSIAADMHIAEPQDYWPLLMRLPEVTAKSETEEMGEGEWEAVSAAVDEALADTVAFRKQEGGALMTKLEEKVRNIGALLSSLEPYETSRVAKIRSRIVETLKTIPEVEYDKNRLEQELIYYIEKLDISEEKQRLANHLNYFLETLHQEAGQGKKLGFIAQEMGREINTTGSKSNNAEMQNIVVKMKDELEQIKEQVLNVL